MKTLVVVLCLLFAPAVLTQAQVVPPSDPPAAVEQLAVKSPGLWSALTDASNVTNATYILANVADSTTDWRWSMYGKQYQVSAVQRTIFAGATLGGAIALSHYIPKAQRWVTIGLVIGSSILAGRAYGHSLLHGVPGPVVVTPTIQ
jgi:hypothetical protein